MYLYTFENHNCPKSPIIADKNDILKKHQKSPILAGFARMQMKFDFISTVTFKFSFKN